MRAAENGIEMGEHATPHLRPHLGPAFRGIVRNQAVKLWAFCCTTCGYVELQLLDPAAIAFVSDALPAAATVAMQTDASRRESAHGAMTQPPRARKAPASRS